MACKNKENKVFSSPVELLCTTWLKGSSDGCEVGKALVFNFSNPEVPRRCLGLFPLCSFSQDVKNRRNPRLVPYILLDERTKKSNKDSLREAVRTLLGYGYNLEAPDQDHGTVPSLHCIYLTVYLFFIILSHFQG